MNWYTIKAAAAVAELFIYDVIESAETFVRELAALPSSIRTVKVRINSPGGNPFEAVAIANALRAQRTEKARRVEVAIEGLAASAATLPPMAGDTVAIARNALVMIHNPIGATVGQAADHRAMAEALDKVSATMVDTYRWRVPLSPAALRALMNATSWLDAEEAVKNGFATEITPAVPVEARHRAETFAQLGPVPPRFRVAASALFSPARRGLDVAAIDSQEAYAKLNRPAPPSRNVFDLYRERDGRRLAMLPGGGR